MNSHNNISLILIVIVAGIIVHQTHSHQLPENSKLLDYIINVIFLKNSNTTPVINSLSNNKPYIIVNKKQLPAAETSQQQPNDENLSISSEPTESVIITSSNNNELHKNYIDKTDDDNSFDDTEGFLARQKTFLDFYYEGVQMYLSNDWESCINYLEHSIELYKEYYEAVVYCRITCEQERNKVQYSFAENYENHHFFEGILKKTLCLEKCRQENLSSYSKWFTLDDDQKLIFKQRKAYQYLQLCYYRDQEIEKAIIATYTALVAQPTDELMKKNIQFYSTLNTFNFEKLKDLEDKEFSGYYMKGVDHYEAKEWQLAIDNFEKFIRAWILEHDKCRVFCESEYYQGWLPDFTTSISNHYVATLRCKQNCTKEMSYSNGRYYEDLFPSAYDYLQFSYNKVGNIKMAVKCVASYLVFYEDSEEMLQNRKYYEGLKEINAVDFIQRNEVKKFVGRAKYEFELLKFVDIEFPKLFAKEDKTFPLLSIQSNLSGSEQTEGYAKETQNVDTNYNFIQILENYKDNFHMKLLQKS